MQPDDYVLAGPTPLEARYAALLRDRGAYLTAPRRTRLGWVASCFLFDGATTVTAQGRSREQALGALVWDVDHAFGGSVVLVAPDG